MIKDMVKSNKPGKWLILLFVFTFYQASNAQLGKSRIDARSFQNKIKSSDNVLIIDTRPAYKFQENRIKDAVLAENQDDLLALLRYVPKSTVILVYCQIGDRSKRAVKLIKQEGFKKIYELEDGLNTWIDASLPLDTIELK